MTVLPKKIKIIIISITLICGSDILHSFSFSQQNKIDSLLNILKTAKEDTTKVNLLNGICWEYKDISPDTAQIYSLQSLELSKKINYKQGIATSYNNSGVVFAYKGDNDKSLENFFKSLKMQEEIGNKKMIANMYNNIGIIYKNKGDYAKSIEAHLKSLAVKEELKDKEGMALSYGNLGLLYYAQKKFDKALEYAYKDLSITKELGNPKILCSSNINIGRIYYESGKNNKNNDDLEKALDFFQTALTIAEKLTLKRQLSQIYNNFGIIYYEQKKYDKAIEYYLKNIKISQEVGNKQSLAITYTNIGELYGKQKQFVKAIEYLNLSVEASKEMGTRNLLIDDYQKFAELYFSMNDYKNAYLYHQLYSQVKDSLFNEESSKQIAEMQTKYETEKKEKEILLLNKDKKLQNVELEKKDAEVKKQNTQKIAFGAGFGLILILALVVFRGYKQKQKSNLLLVKQKQQIEIKNTHLEKANTEISHQKKEIEEKNHEILASIRYAQRIQEAILPPQKLVKQHLEQSFILYKPKDIVAGDFYWMHVSSESGVRSSQTGHLASGEMSQPVRLQTPDSELVSELPPPNSQLILFAACDCTGHGVPGAFVSIVGHNALNRAVKEFGLTEPAKILDKVNELVEETFSKSENQMQDGMDVALCSLELGVKPVLQYAGANNSMYFIRNRELKEIKADKQPIGKFVDRKPFTNNLIELQKGDSIYAFSDGYADQFGGEKGKKFKYSQFEKLLLSIQEKSMTEQREILNDAIEKWRGELEQIDDICVIGVRV